jgi:ribosomal-protein-alanine N-acetyltransferase
MLTFKFNPFPILETDRLILRKITQADAINFFEMRKDTAVMRYIDRPLPKEITEINELISVIEKNIDLEKAIAWAITLKGNSSLIGTIGYHRTIPENHRAEIGYQLMSGYWRKGIMNEAIKAVINFGFNQMKLHSMEANVNPKNEASISLLNKLGFSCEAHFKEDYYFDGKFLDSMIYSLLTPHQQS